MKEEIISRIDIHEYINRYISLQQKGPGQYSGLCPFHNEKTPSFSVSTDKKFFHCFGCKASGDVITFVMLFDKITFSEALRRLGDECGVAVDNKINSKFQKNKKFLEINALFTKICNELLYEPSCYYGLEYVKSRGIKDEIIQKYKLGYLPINKFEIVLSQLIKNFSQEDIIKSGVIKINSNNSLYSPFTGRIIFPIFDTANHNVGFGSRIIKNDNAKAKYLNSSDSDFFHKSEILYGIEHLLGDSQMQKMDTVFVVEGYMDVISLANNGISNAVGVLGANLTQMQLKQLWKFNNKPTICLDGDSAGKIAMERTAKMSLTLIEPTKTIVFLEMELCKDPDEFIRKYGTEEFLKMFQRKKLPLADYVYQTQKSDLSMDNPDEVVVLRQRLATISNEITNDALRNAYKSHFNKLFYTKKSADFNKYNKKSVYKDKLRDTEVAVLSGTISKKNYSNIEEEICNIINTHKELLLDQMILDDFMRCKLTSAKANRMRVELTKIIPEVYLGNTDKLEENKKHLSILFLSLEVRNVQNEISTLEDANVTHEELKLLQLKQYEIQLKTKLSSILI
jgi:DNA primase